MTKFLAEDENYKVTSEWETVYLHFKNATRAPVDIGYFYGDPQGAIFHWPGHVIIYGYGIIIYRLQEPFTPYHYTKATSQYTELHNQPDDHWWVDTAYIDNLDAAKEEELNTGFFRFVMYNDDNKLRVFRMNLTTYEVEQID